MVNSEWNGGHDETLCPPYAKLLELTVPREAIESKGIIFFCFFCSLLTQPGLSVNGLSPGPGNFAFRPPADSPLMRDSTSGYGYMVTAPFSGKQPESIDDPYTL